MDSTDRLRRDEPERTGPIRNRAVPPPRSAGASSPVGAPGAAMGALVDEGMRTAWRVMDGASRTAQGAVERGVETAYQVIEEYMARGREAAGRYSQRNGETPMSDDRQYGNAWPGNSAFNGPMGPMSPMVMPWIEMMRMWASTMQSFVPGAGTMGTDWMNQFMPGTFPQSAYRGPVAVHLSSKAPAEVTVDLAPGADQSALRIDSLSHTTNHQAPPLVGIGIERMNGTLRVRVAVPNDQPAGSYRGAITDTTGARRGELRVDVDGSAPPSTSAGAA